MNSRKKNAEKAIDPTHEGTRFFRALMSYLGCIAICFAVMYFWNGTIGILTATALITALVLSLAVTIPLSRDVTVDAATDKANAAKGETVQCLISFRKNLMVPAPIIEAKVSCSSHLSLDTQYCCVSLAGREKSTVSTPIRVCYSGAAEIIIDSFAIIDHLGIFRFKLNNVSPIVLKLSVYPNLPDVPVQTEFLKESVLYNGDDDEEEETNETALGQSGMPGYDYREYYPGDPIRRINWKLSSKRDVYMIRLDEKKAGSGQVFLLDIPYVEENQVNLAVRDCVIEGMLAAFSMIIREGREIICFYPYKNIWQRADLVSMAHLEQLREQLSQFETASEREIIPMEIIQLPKTPICFSAATSEYPQSAEQIVLQFGGTPIIAAESSLLPKVSPVLWLITDDFEFIKQ